jgi:diguanylate cyclase (GGDEF)-like protein
MCRKDFWLKAACCDGTGAGEELGHMTLGRQLLSGTALIFIALLVGIESIYVSTAKKSLETQLDAHANETATSLALSLGARLSSMDESVLNIMVNPVFDRGHFQSIAVTDAKGGTVFARALDAHDMDVPAWFVKLVSIEGPRGEALVSSGWRQLGKVTVKVHPEYAYKQLYDTALATLAWLLMLFAIALMAMRIHLEEILKPLKRIEETATAISNRKFVSMDMKPRTRELQRVVAAMNILSAKVREVIADESARAERLRREAYEDALTGQLNRRGFDNAVDSALGEDVVHAGTLALFALGGLEEINKSLGLSKGNEVLRQLAGALATPADPRQRAPIVGRWQGPTLAVFLPNASPEEARAWAGTLCRSFAEELHRAGLPAVVTASAGLASYSGGGAKLDELGKRAESALAQACSRGTGEAAAEGAGAPRIDARAQVEEAIGAGRVSLLCQKVMSVPDPTEAIQVEFMARLMDAAGQPVAAAVFVPIAAQYGLLAALDRRVVETAVAALAGARAPALPQTVSLNVSLQSVSDKGFREALGKLLKTNPAVARRLVFEMTGASASRAKELCAKFSAELRPLGSRLALDNFEVDRDSIGLVHELMPAYIKLAPVFTREIGEREDVRFILEAMLRMVRPLEIPIIAQGVEDAALVAVLRELGVAGYQGYAAGRPEPLVL